MAERGTPRGKRSRQQAKRFYHTLILVVVGLLCTLLVALVQPFSSINRWLSDQLFTSEPPSPNIVVLGIDNETLATYGRWADWPRHLHTQAIENLTTAGAKVIAFDVLFADPSPDDQALAAAVEGAGNVVLAAAGVKPVPTVEPEPTYERFILPLSELEEASAAIGHANIIPDPDGTVRRLPLVTQDAHGRSLPSLSLATLHILFSMPPPESLVAKDGSLHALARDIPVDDSCCLRINFAYDNDARPYVPYGDVISGSFNPSEVRNKVVLIGIVATGELDTWAVPTSSQKVSGVLIHAAAMDTILRQGFLKGTGIGITVAIMLVLAGICALALPRLRLRWGAVTVGALFAGYLVASFLAFDRGYLTDIL